MWACSLYIINITENNKTVTSIEPFLYGSARQPNRLPLLFMLNNFQHISKQSAANTIPSKSLNNPQTSNSPITETTIFKRYFFRHTRHHTDSHVITQRPKMNCSRITITVIVSPRCICFFWTQKCFSQCDHFMGSSPDYIN